MYSSMRNFSQRTRIPLSDAHGRIFPPTTWTAWLGCVGRAPEGKRAPSRASPRPPPSYPLLPFPPRNCIGGSQGGTPPCLRALKITLKKISPHPEHFPLPIPNPLLTFISHPSPPSPQPQSHHRHPNHQNRSRL